MESDQHYSGNEGSWQYGNQIDASLISPYFVVAPSTELRYHHYYRTEVTYDYGFVELDNGSGWWKELEILDGIHAFWSEEVYDISAYAGQTSRVRFRFVTDPNTIDEGWYVDDVSFGVPAAIQDKPDEETKESFALMTAPSGTGYSISFSIPEQAVVMLSIHDLTGRRIAQLCNAVLGQGNHHIHWHAAKVPNGVYFARLWTKKKSVTGKIVVIR